MQTLPNDYKKILTVNLQTNKKLLIGINAAAFVIIAAMMLIMTKFVEFSLLYDIIIDPLGGLIKFAVLALSSMVYIVLHEAVHAIFMKIFGTKKVNFGVTGFYAYAGSNDYYNKKQYIIIALAPVIIWGLVLAVINALVPSNWFWIVYIIQVMNISGAVGDFYVTWKFSKLPDDVLVRDSGIEMTIYSSK